MITSFITLRGPISYRGSGAAAIRTSGWLSFHLFLGDAQLILQPFQLAFSVHLAIFRKVFVMQVTGVDEREIGNPLVAEKLIRSSNQKQSSKKKSWVVFGWSAFFLGGWCERPCATECFKFQNALTYTPGKWQKGMVWACRVVGS